MEVDNEGLGQERCERKLIYNNDSIGHPGTNLFRTGGPHFPHVTSRRREAVSLFSRPLCGEKIGDTC